MRDSGFHHWRVESHFPRGCIPLFLDVDANSMQSIVNFMATYCVDFRFRSSSGNAQEDVRNEQRRMKGILEKAREGRLSEEDIESASTPHERYYARAKLSHFTGQ